MPQGVEVVYQLYALSNKILQIWTVPREGKDRCQQTTLGPHLQIRLLVIIQLVVVVDPHLAVATVADPQTLDTKTPLEGDSSEERVKFWI